MRHIYFRGIAGIIWLAAALASVGSGNFEMGILYVILSVLFGYAAYASWKKEKNDKGGR